VDAVLAITLCFSFLLQGPASLPLTGIGGKAVGGGSQPIQLIGTPVQGDNGGTSTSKVLAYTGATANNTLVVGMNATAANCTSIGISDSGSGAIVSVYVQNFANTFGITALSIITGISSGSHTVTITPTGTCSGSNLYVQGCVSEWQGITPTSPVDATALTGSGTTTSPAASSAFSTVQAKELSLNIATATGPHTGDSSGTATNLCKFDANSYVWMAYEIFAATKSSYQSTIGWSAGAATTISTVGTVKGN
jgi:hypothetical protein